MNLYLHAIQRSKGKYAYEYVDDKLKIVNTQTNETIEYTEIVTKKGEINCRVNESVRHRYITKKRNRYIFCSSRNRKNFTRDITRTE